MLVFFYAQKFVNNYRNYAYNCKRVNCKHNNKFITMNIKEKFGQKVKTLREEKNFSIEQLANISNVDRNYISDIEKGKRNVSIEIMEE